MVDLNSFLNGNGLDPIEDDDYEDGFDSIDEGWYEARCEKAEIYQFDSGDVNLNLSLVILGPNFVNRRIWPSHSVVNSVEMRQKIGHKEMKQLFEAVGIDSLDTDLLVNETVDVFIKKTNVSDVKESYVKERDDGSRRVFGNTVNRDDCFNEVKKYRPAGGDIDFKPEKFKEPERKVDKETNSETNDRGSQPPWVK